MGQEKIKSIAGQPTVDAAMTNAASPLAEQEKTPFILVVTRNGHMTEPVMNYAINVADHLKYGILAVHINTLPFFRDGGRREVLFAAAMQESALVLRAKAGAKGVLVEHLGESGKIGKVVQRLCHSGKKIEFVVIDQGIRREEVTSQAPVPVFSVIYTNAGTNQINKTTSYKTMKIGELFMSTTSKKRHVKNCFLFGALTAGVYAAVFTNQDLVMTYSPKAACMPSCRLLLFLRFPMSMEILRVRFGLLWALKALNRPPSASPRMFARRYRLLMQSEKTAGLVLRSVFDTDREARRERNVLKTRFFIL